MNQRKATRAQLKQHNQQLILRTIYEEEAISRAALAQETGLAKPTVSDIVSELIDAGFIEEGERGESTSSGGKRPRMLHFSPASRQIIAVSVEPTEINGALAYLDSSVVAQHYLPRDEDTSTPLMQQIQAVINALIIQADAPLLCISLGVPGIVDNQQGIVKKSSRLGWYNQPVAEHLRNVYDVPTFVSNNTELAARVNVAYQNEANQLVTVLVTDSVEIGIAFDGQVYHHGGDISNLPLPESPVNFLSWDAIVNRTDAILADHPESILNNGPLTYLEMRYALTLDDPAACQLLDEIAGTLAHIYGWIIGLMRPDEIVLVGDISDIGDALIYTLRDHLKHYFPDDTLDAIVFSMADAHHVSVRGAVANGLNKALGIL